MREVLGPLKVQRYIHVRGSSSPSTVQDAHGVNITPLGLARIAWRLEPVLQRLRPIESKTAGVSAASAISEGETLALAKPDPHHRAAVSIAANALPSLAAPALESSRVSSMSVNDSRISGRRGGG